MSKETSVKLMRQLHFLTAVTRRGDGHRPVGGPPPMGNPHPDGGHRPEGGPPPAGGMPPPPPHGAGRILGILVREEGISQSRLAEMMEIRPQSLSEGLGKLEADGMITRQTSEEDKRSTLVFITEKGRQTAAHVKERMESFASDFFAALSDEEQETLTVLLEKVIASKKSQK